MGKVKTHFKSTSAGIALALAGAVVCAQPVKIGVAGPFTGAAAAYGEQVWAGVSTYINSVNANGGLSGRPIALIQGDDACEPKQAVTVANRFVDQERVDAVIGHFCSATSLPASNVYHDAGVLMITYASTAPALTERKLNNVFRTCGRDDQQAVFAAEFILNDLKKSRIALVHDKDAYGKGLVDAIRAELAAHGVTPVLYEGLSKGERDFNALVTKIRAARADVVYFGGLIPEGGPLIRQIQEQGLAVDFVSGDSFSQAQLIAAAGGAANLQNVYYSAPPDPMRDPTTQGVQDALKAAHITPDTFTMYGFAAAQAMVAALSDGRVGNLAAQAQWLRSNELTSAIGVIRWSDKGDVANFRYVFFKFDESGTAIPW